MLKKVTSLLLALCIIAPNFAYAARLKDIADIEGVRGNQLIGYGLVVGLSGTGDKRGAIFTPQSMSNLLERLGIRVNAAELKLANVAAVVATATLPPFARPGAKIDVTLSSIGDASTLQGGVLVMTPLKGADGKVYAVAQGPITVGGFATGAGQDKTQKNHPTVGVMPGGASVERTLPFDLFANGEIRVVLRNADFTTATRLQRAINRFVGEKKARAVDNTSVVLKLDAGLSSSPVELLAKLEDIEVEPDAPARVVVNERTGTIVMGDKVRVSTVALAHGSLNVSISSETKVSQPNALSQGKTSVVQNNDMYASEEGSNLTLVKKNVNLGEVVKALNSLGVTPRDLISILQAMQKAGALQAELVTM